MYNVNLLQDTVDTMKSLSFNLKILILDYVFMTELKLKSHNCIFIKLPIGYLNTHIDCNRLSFYTRQECPWSKSFKNIGVDIQLINDSLH